MTSPTKVGAARHVAIALIVSACSVSLIACGADSSTGQSAVVSVAKRDVSALIDAVEDGNIDQVRALVSIGADVNARHPGDGTPLMVAARQGDLSMVNALLALGANGNSAASGDGTALITASGVGHLEVVERLVAAGAKIDTAVIGDETALITASREGHLDVVQYLVVNKANVNLGARTGGGHWRTPLNQAATSSIREFLIKNGAVVSGK